MEGRVCFLSARGDLWFNADCVSTGEIHKLSGLGGSQSSKHEPGGAVYLESFRPFPGGLRHDLLHILSKEEIGAAPTHASSHCLLHIETVRHTAWRTMCEKLWCEFLGACHVTSVFKYQIVFLSLQRWWNTLKMRSFQNAETCVYLFYIIFPLLYVLYLRFIKEKRFWLY